MLRYFLTLSLSISLLSNLFSQTKLQPVKWTAQVKKINSTTYDIIFTANIQSEWYLYSQTQERNDGPLPTTFIFQKNQSYNRNGLVKESWVNKIKEKDPVFDMIVTKYKISAMFTQRITTSQPSEVIVMIEYMSCKATSCLPERYVEFKIDLNQLGTTFKPSSFIY